MESCFTTGETYVGCEAGPDVTNSGLPLGGGAGQVDVTGESATGFTILATSRSGNTFTYQKAGSAVTKSCTGGGGCNGGTW
jgi:hypothetical protein